MKLRETFKPTPVKLLFALLLPVYLAYDIQLQPAAGKPDITYDLEFYLIPYLLHLGVSLGGLFADITGAQVMQEPVFPWYEDVFILVMRHVVPLIVAYVLACLLIEAVRRIRTRR